MVILSVAYFLLLVSDATGVRDVNTTVGKSTILPCFHKIPETTGLQNLRFYWQDEQKAVLYSFNEGTEMPEHVDRLYQGRITAFPQDMKRGNLSVKLENTTLEDNQNVFQVFAAVFERGGMRNDVKLICQMTLHVAVPYESVSLAVNETMTAVCTALRGFPKPLVKWRLQQLSLHFSDPSDVHTTAAQDPNDHLYSLRSTINIPGGPYRSATCLIYNPTLNVTLNKTLTLNNGGAERSLPGWALALMMAAVLVLI